MKIRCICGALMNDETSENCIVYNTYIDKDYYDLLDSNPKTIEELVDNMPSSDLFWQCTNCDRLHFFRKGKIQIYKSEREVGDSF